MINDFPISKFHAQIITFQDLYFIIDLNSINGVSVNERAIEPTFKVKLDVNSQINFGIMPFMFMSPYHFYQSVKALA